jgi:hypothetical protein
MHVNACPRLTHTHIHVLFLVQNRFEEAERIALFPASSFLPAGLDHMQRTIDGPSTSHALTVPQISVTEVSSGALRKSSNGMQNVAMSTSLPMHQKLALERTLSSRHSPTLFPHNETEREYAQDMSRRNRNHSFASSGGYASSGHTHTATHHSPPSGSAPGHNSPRGGGVGGAATMSSTAGHVPALVPSSMTVQNAGVVTAAILNSAEVAAHCEKMPAAGPTSHKHAAQSQINAQQQAHTSPAVEEAGPGSQWVVEVTVHEARDLPTPPQRSRGVRDVFCCASLLHQQTDLTVRSCHVMRVPRHASSLVNHSCLHCCQDHAKVCVYASYSDHVNVCACACASCTDHVVFAVQSHRWRFLDHKCEGAKVCTPCRILFHRYAHAYVCIYVCTP